MFEQNFGILFQKISSSPFPTSDTSAEEKDAIDCHSKFLALLSVALNEFGINQFFISESATQSLISLVDFMIHHFRYGLKNTDKRAAISILKLIVAAMEPNESIRNLFAGKRAKLTPIAE